MIDMIALRAKYKLIYIAALVNQTQQHDNEEVIRKWGKLERLYIAIAELNSHI